MRRASALVASSARSARSEIPSARNREADSLFAFWERNQAEFRTGMSSASGGCGWALKFSWARPMLKVELTFAGRPEVRSEQEFVW